MRKYISPAMLCLYAGITPVLRTYALGKLLDAGCGSMPFRRYLTPLVDEYHSLDIEKRVPDVEFVSNLENMRSVIHEDFDVVLCTEVLEHTPHPQIVICEIWQILKFRGKVILSVPFLSRLHEEPFDYYRFTEHGLRLLLKENGFSILELKSTGSFFSFVGHQISTCIVGSLWHLPVIKYLAFSFNTIFCTLPCYLLDMVPFLSRKFPLGYVVVAEKIDASHNPKNATD